LKLDRCDAVDNINRQMFGGITKGNVEAL